MVTTKQMNLKNSYFYNYLINIKNFDPNLLKLDKKSFRHWCLLIGYITKKMRIHKIDKEIHTITKIDKEIHKINKNFKNDTVNKRLCIVRFYVVL